MYTNIAQLQGNSDIHAPYRRSVSGTKKDPNSNSKVVWDTNGPTLYADDTL